MIAVTQAFNGCNLLARGAAHLRYTRTNGDSVLMNGAGTALADAAAELRSGKSGDVPQVPKQRHVGIAIELALCTIDFERNH